MLTGRFRQFNNKNYEFDVFTAIIDCANGVSRNNVNGFPVVTNERKMLQGDSKEMGRGQSSVWCTKLKKKLSMRDLNPKIVIVF